MIGSSVCHPREGADNYSAIFSHRQFLQMLFINDIVDIGAAGCEQRKLLATLFNQCEICPKSKRTISLIDLINWQTRRKLYQFQRLQSPAIGRLPRRFVHVDRQSSNGRMSRTMPLDREPH